MCLATEAHVAHDIWGFQTMGINGSSHESHPSQPWSSRISCQATSPALTFKIWLHQNRTWDHRRPSWMDMVVAGHHMMNTSSHTLFITTIWEVCFKSIFHNGHLVVSCLFLRTWGIQETIDSPFGKPPICPSPFLWNTLGLFSSKRLSTFHHQPQPQHHHQGRPRSRDRSSGPKPMEFKYAKVPPNSYGQGAAWKWMVKTTTIVTVNRLGNWIIKL